MMLQASKFTFLGKSLLEYLLSIVSAALIWMGSRFRPGPRTDGDFIRSAATLDHTIRCSFTVDSDLVEYDLYPSRACTKLVLSGKWHDNPEAQGFARYVSTYGIAQVLIPVRQACSPSNNQSAGFTASTNEDVVKAIVHHTRKSFEQAPVLIRISTPDRGVTYAYTGSHYGRDGDLPPLQFFTARDGERLAYRHYRCASSRAMILIHGGSSHSAIYGTLAHYLSARGVAQVYTPNLRGHAHSGKRTGDVSYVGQLEDDLIDFIQEIRTRMPEAKMILAGHSFGGGFLVRFAGGRPSMSVDGYVLLAPYLGHLASINPRADSSGWVRIRLVHLFAAAIANRIGASRWNDRPVIGFSPPHAVRDGEETLAYSFRLLTSISPRLNYRRDLMAIAQPLLVAVGEADELFHPEAYVKEIARTKRGCVRVIPGATHLGVVFDPRVHHIIADWLDDHVNLTGE